MLLWLCHRPAAAATIGPLTPELPYAAGAAIKKKKIVKVSDEFAFFLYFSMKFSQNVVSSLELFKIYTMKILFLGIPKYSKSFKFACYSIFSRSV